jgi:hypothetical protein
MPRMSFKQIWTDRPDERFDMKTREVLLDIHSTVSDVGQQTSRDAQSAHQPQLNGATLDRTVRSTSGRASSTTADALVYGLIVDVEILPAIPAEQIQSARLHR